MTADPKLREMENAARLLDRGLMVVNARNESEFEQAFLSVEEQQIGAMVVTSDTMFSNGARRSAARPPGMQCRRWAPIAISRAPAG